MILDETLQGLKEIRKHLLNQLKENKPKEYEQFINEHPEILNETETSEVSSKQ